MTMGLSENRGFTGKNRAKSREVLEYWNILEHRDSYEKLLVS